MKAVESKRSHREENINTKNSIKCARMDKCARMSELKIRNVVVKTFRTSALKSLYHVKGERVH